MQERERKCSRPVGGAARSGIESWSSRIPCHRACDIAQSRVTLSDDVLKISSVQNTGTIDNNPRDYRGF
eukprot:1383479-Amorphochlora_amoeboformis.AAC.1